MPIFAAEPKTPEVQAVLVEDSEILVGWTCRTEVKSAIHGKVREGNLSAQDATVALTRIDTMFGGRSLEIPPDEAIRDETEALLSRRTLRAVDAFHLAAWKLYGSHLPFICLDDQLKTAALAEGATLLP